MNRGDLELHAQFNLDPRESSPLLRLLPDKPANALQLGRDLAEVEKLYGTRGYLSAHVQSQATFDDGSRTVNYALMVREGAQYHMGKLEITGLDARAVEKLDHDSKLHAGDPFNRAYWTDFLKENARDVPRNPRGWKVQSKMTTHEDSKTVDVTIALSPARP